MSESPLCGVALGSDKEQANIIFTGKASRLLASPTCESPYPSHNIKGEGHGSSITTYRGRSWLLHPFIVAEAEAPRR